MAGITATLSLLCLVAGVSINWPPQRSCAVLNSMQVQFRDILQAVSGKHKGVLCQVLSVSDDGADVLSLSFDGSQYLIKIPSSEFDSWRKTGGLAVLGPKPDSIVGTAALGPGTGASPAPVLQPAVPPPLNPEELLAPLPPEVKAQPMNQPANEPKKPKEKKPKPEPFSGALVPYIFTVTNGAGDTAEVPLKVRADKKTSRYKGAAIIQALKVLAPTKPYKVECRRID